MFKFVQMSTGTFDQGLDTHIQGLTITVDFICAEMNGPVKLGARQETNPSKEELLQSLNRIVDGVQKWKNYEQWSRSNQREQFYETVKKLNTQNQNNSGLPSCEVLGIKTDRQSCSLVKSELTHPQFGSTSTLQSEQHQDELRRFREKGQQKELVLFQQVPFSVVSLRRSAPKPRLPVYRGNKRFHVFRGYFEVTYYILHDIFFRTDRVAFKDHQYLVIASDLSWIYRNKTSPKKLRHLKEDQLKRLIVDYYYLTQKYSTPQILEYYSLDFILQALCRSIMLVKGSSTPQLLRDFTQKIDRESWQKHFTTVCKIKFQTVRETDQCHEMALDVHGTLVNVIDQKDRIYVECNSQYP